MLKNNKKKIKEKVYNLIYIYICINEMLSIKLEIINK